MKKLFIAAFCLSAMMFVTSCEKPTEPKQDDDPEVEVIQPTEKEKNMVTEPMAWRLDSLTISVERTAKVVLQLPILSERNTNLVYAFAALTFFL